MELTEVVDRLRIADLLHAYADTVDRSDVDALAALFTEDATMDMGHGAVFSGREQLRALFLQRIGWWTTTNHHLSNVLVRDYDVSPTSATARTTTYLYAFHDSPARGATMHLWARYDDELVRDADRWLIHVRRLRVAGVRETASAPVPERFETVTRPSLPER